MRNERFEIDWCPALAFDANGDHDMDRERRNVAYYLTLPSAVDAAKRLLRDGKDAYGAILVTRQERLAGFPRTTDHEWENVETLEVSDPDDIYTEADFTSHTY